MNGLNRSGIAAAAWLAAALASNAAAQTAAPAPAQTATPAASSGGGLASKLINVPNSNWSIYGNNQTNKRLEKDGPQGYPAIRATISAQGTNPWDSGALSVIDKPIGHGDVVLIAVYLRAPDLKDGETTPIPFLGVTKSSAPYDTIATGKAALTNQWKVYFASGKTAQDYAAGGAQAAIHLAAAKHVVDLGPVRIYDLGPDFDTNRLPK